MAWIQPKTDWKGGDVPSSDDFNRIEGNVAVLGGLREFSKAQGTATDIIVSTGTDYFQLIDGRAITFIASAANGKAATTINIDNTGALPLYRPGTTQAPNIIAGKAYTVWYSAASGCFFLKASAEGDAQASDVLAGKLFSNDDDTGIAGALTLTGTAADADVLAGKTYYNTNAKTKRTGSMPNNGAQNKMISSPGSVTIPAGYTSGGTVTANYLKGPTFAAGDDCYFCNPNNMGSHYVNDTEYTKHKEFQMLYGGTIRVSVTMEAQDDGDGIYAKIYVNGVARGVEHYTNNSSSGLDWEEDISVNAGDLVQLYFKGQAGGGSFYDESGYIHINNSSLITTNL